MTMHQGGLFDLEGDDNDRSQRAQETEGCSFDRCDRPFHARWKGEMPYCKTHYEQARQNKPLSPIRMMLTRGTYTECQLDGCDRPHSSGGYCDGHHQQQQKSSPLKPLRSWVSQAEGGRMPIRHLRGPSALSRTVHRAPRPGKIPVRPRCALRPSRRPLRHLRDDGTGGQPRVASGPRPRVRQRPQAGELLRQVRAGPSLPQLQPARTRLVRE